MIFNHLCLGASESEIYIWDVNKTTAPMTPGPKSQPMDDVRCIAWNRQVQHILASSFASRSDEVSVSFHLGFTGFNWFQIFSRYFL